MKRKKIELNIFIEKDGTINIPGLSMTALELLLPIKPEDENLNNLKKIFAENKIKEEIPCG